MLLVRSIENESDITLPRRRGLETRVLIILFPPTLDTVKTPILKAKLHLIYFIPIKVITRYPRASLIALQGSVCWHYTNRPFNR